LNYRSGLRLTPDKRHLPRLNPKDQDGGFGDFPPRFGRVGIPLGVSNFGLFEQPIDRAGSTPLKVLGRYPSNVGIVHHGAAV
jgi:hypothetical protein